MGRNTIRLRSQKEIIMSAKLLIPQKFFKTLKEEYPPIYALMWIEWLGYGGLIFNPNFKEKLRYKNVPIEKVRECYDMGILFFQEGLVFSDEELKTKKETKPEKQKPKEKQEKEIVDTDIELIKAVVEYLNEKAGTEYKYQTIPTQKLISARIKEGYKFEHFQKVIDTKVYDWKGTDMEKFLRPQTLFTPSKFENYLNQKVFYGKEQPKSTIDNYQESIDEAKRKLFGNIYTNGSGTQGN